MCPTDGLGGVVEPQAEVYARESETIDKLAVDIAHVGVSAVGVETREVAGGGAGRADLEALVFVCKADRCSAACGLVESLGEDGASLSPG